MKIRYDIACKVISIAECLESYTATKVTTLTHCADSDWTGNQYIEKEYIVGVFVAYGQPAAEPSKHRRRRARRNKRVQCVIARG